MNHLIAACYLPSATSRQLVVHGAHRGKGFHGSYGDLERMRKNLKPLRTTDARGRTVIALAALIGFGLLATACGSTPAATKATNPVVTTADLTQFSGPGPFAVGTTKYVVNGDSVVIWYPVEKTEVAGLKPYTYHLRSWLPAAIQHLIPSGFPDGVTEDAYFGVPAAAGSFPVVLFSHGYGGYPEQSTFLTAHLASWGMIVVAADQLKRDLTAVILGKASSVEPKTDVSEQLAALAYVKNLDKMSGSLLFGRVDSAKVATLGHSAGGGTAVLVADADPAIRGWIALAGVPVTPPAVPVPSLMISGSSDKTVPTSKIRTFYNTVSGHKTFLVIDGYGHNVFDDICTINHAHGGVVAGVRELHLPVPPALLQLATDGCSPPDIYPPSAWPLIDQAVTSQLRYDFGQSSTPLESGSALRGAYPVLETQVSSAS